jgi:hypothetical protein
VTGTGKARDLVPDEREQAALAEIRELRAAGKSLVAIRDEMRGRGFSICKQTVANILARQEAEAPAKPSSAKLQIPAGWIDKTDEALRAGGTLTIIGAPRPKKAEPA